MYPTIYHLVKDLLGIDIFFLKPFQSFGFFIAISFLLSSWFLIKELKRKEKLGVISSHTKKVMVGKAASISELLLSGIFGFIIGFKLIEIIFDFDSFVSNTQGFIFSMQGSYIGGFLGAIIGVYLRYREKQKDKLEKPKLEDVEVHPYELTGNIIILGAVFGIIGAKIFDNLENFDSFLNDPIGSLFSFSGLTFYGGLILAAIVIILYVKKRNISPLKICDIAAPSLILAYALGRIGCQVAGDGDWGILNSAYISQNETKVELVKQPSQYKDSLLKYQVYYSREFDFKDVAEVPHYSVKAPSWLPTWLFAYNYAHNVNGEGVPIKSIKNKWAVNGKDYNYVLPLPVFPTPIYEIIVCLLFFLLLWSIRKKITTTGVMFALFLMLNGIERFFIEKIRVNTKYNILGGITQAEIISTLLFIAGLVLLIYVLNQKKKEQKEIVS